MKIVGIGASAGGIEALREFLKHLSPKTGAAFVVIQHLSPDFKSIMDDLLQKFTKMPIEILEEDKVLSPDHIYLMPGDKMLTYEHGMIKLHDRDKLIGLNLPIDRFFHSLGKNLKKDAIAIVLSGSGTDGSRGGRTVKEHGGIVLVQSPDSARFNSMPNALIRLDIADSILAPVELALKVKQLLSLAKKQSSSAVDSFENIDKVWFSKVLGRVSEIAGIRFSDYKFPTLYRRIEKRMALIDLEKIEEYYRVLKDNEEETEALFRDFLINVTQFFRNPEIFQYLAEEIIPKIFAELPSSQVCRIWVPACSTGEEAYTIGMIVAEHIRKNKLEHDFKIFASDVSKKSIAFATRGVYNTNISSDVPEDFLVRYFVRQGDEYEIKQNVREKVIFALHNAVNDPPFIRMQLVSCRNFLIYLKPATQDRVLRTFYFALQAEAYMLLGPSETIGDLKNVFTRQHRVWNIYQKRNVDYMNIRQNYHPPSSLWVKQKPTAVKIIQGQQFKMPSFSDDYKDPFSLFLLDKFSPTVIFVNENLDVLYLNGEIESYLRLPRALATLNLDKMLSKENSIIFQDGVRMAFDSEEVRVYENIEFVKEGVVELVRVMFQRLKLELMEDAVVMIQIEKQQAEETTGEEQVMSKMNIREADFVNEKILRLEKELNAKKKELNDLAERMELTNEELNTSNRELMASNEELQSTNEELQSVNEELHTVNAELQFKNEELTISTNDISNLLKSTNIGTIFLDKELKIRKFTQAIRRQFDLIGSDIGRPITVFANNLVGVDLEKICREVFKKVEPYEQQVNDQRGEAFLLRVLPYYTEQDEVEGCVLTFVDINEIIKIKQDKLRLARKFKALLSMSDLPFLFVLETGYIKQVNLPIGDFAVLEMEGNNLFKLIPKQDRVKFKRTMEAAFLNKTYKTIQLFLPSKKRELGYHYEFRIIPIINEESPNEELSTAVIAAYENTHEYENRAKLETTKEIYQSFMQNADHQIALIDRKGKIVDLNYAQHSGKTPDELIGKIIYDLLPPGEVKEYKKSVEQVFNGESKSSIKFKYIDKHQQELEVTLVATPVIVNEQIEFVALIGSPVKN